MTTRLKPIDATQVQTGSVRRRHYRLALAQLASMPKPAEPLQEFYHSLPKLGAARTLLSSAELLARAAVEEKPIIWIVDGGLMDLAVGPLVIHLLRRGLIQCLVLNGEVAVRDFEIAFHGKTDEDVATGVADGLLGMARETGETLNAIINEGVKRGFSLGESIGRGILDRQPRHLLHSMLAAAASRLTLTTIHMSLGADGFHRYPGADGAMLGKGSLKDAHLLGGYLSQLPPGAVIVAAHRDAALTQVFTHAYALGRNLNSSLKGIHILRLGDHAPEMRDLAGTDVQQSLGGPLEIMLPLLMGALFTLVE